MANNLTGTSNDNIVPGVKGENTGKGPAIHGESTDGRGVEGKSVNNYGVRAHSEKSAGLWATSAEGPGILSNSTNFEGVAGGSIKGNGVAGTSNTGSGVFGASDSGAGVFGRSETGRGLAGFSTTGQAVFGHSTEQAGAVGVSEKFVGVWGESKSVDQPGVFGKGKLAGLFEGNVIITGTVTAHNDIVCGKADFAEDFDIVTYTEPGEVMVLTESGALAPSTKAYDRKVVGVLSGAGSYKPGIILDKQNDSENRQPVAMMGKVYCKVDADNAPIETGDLLTTSDTPGYAMKADDSFRAFGAVIGKALASLQSGKGLIPMLVVLQ